MISLLYPTNVKWYWQHLYVYFDLIYDMILIYSKSSYHSSSVVWLQTSRESIIYFIIYFTIPSILMACYNQVKRTITTNSGTPFLIQGTKGPDNMTYFFQWLYMTRKKSKNPRKFMEMYLMIRYFHEKKEFLKLNEPWLFGLSVENDGDPYIPIPITIFCLTHIYDKNKNKNKNRNKKKKFLFCQKYVQLLK